MPDEPDEKKPTIVRVVLSLYPTDREILTTLANTNFDGNESAAARHIFRLFARSYPQQSTLPIREQ